MNDIRRFERRVLQHTEFDDDEGFDENTQNESVNLFDMASAARYEQKTKDSAVKGKTDPLFAVMPYTKPLQKGQIDSYILEIRRRLQEDIHARRGREKQRRKVLLDQLRALDALIGHLTDKEVHEQCSLAE